MCLWEVKHSEPTPLQVDGPLSNSKIKAPVGRPAFFRGCQCEAPELSSNQCNVSQPEDGRAHVLVGEPRDAQPAQCFSPPDKWCDSSGQSVQTWNELPR